jgi:hypothetical protein
MGILLPTFFIMGKKKKIHYHGLTYKKFNLVFIYFYITGNTMYLINTIKASRNDVDLSYLKMVEVCIDY